MRKSAAVWCASGILGLGYVGVVIRRILTQSAYKPEAEDWLCHVALPLVAYFAIMFFLAFATSKALGLNYSESAALSFTAAGNNFELAIAVAVGMFGIASSEALAAVVGPLIEVPALVALVYVALWLKRALFPDESDPGLKLPSC